MKPIQLIFISAVLFTAASCSSTKNTSSTPDDVYYSASDHQNEPQPAAAVNAPPADYSRDNSNYNPDNGSNYSQSPSSTEQYSDGKGNTYITNNYNNDDYYDYEYSARLRRYYTPAVGYGYYDPFYTNSYWYDYNPYNFGVSIYLGYNWWAPPLWYYTPFYYGPVYPYHHAYYGCSAPYYGYYPYNYYPYSYGNGYNDGYWNGYNNGAYASACNNPYYYNSYEGNSTYYGPRGSISSNVNTTSPSPRATLGEKYQKSLVAQVVPIKDQQGVTSTQSPVSGTGRPNSSTIVEGSGKQNTSPVKTEPVVEPLRQSISDKNQNGTRPVLDPSSYSTQDRNNTSGISQTPKSNGGNVRPEVDQPSRTNNTNNSRPRNTDVQSTPQNNKGGTVKPGIDQPRINQESRPATTQPRNNQLNQPRNSDYNEIGQPRNGSTNPQQINPRVEPKNEQPRTNPSYERPRQEVQPRIEPRQEPRQYKQEHSQPKQNENLNTPSPRQQNMNTPSPRNNNSSGESKSGGRRK